MKKKSIIAFTSALTLAASMLPSVSADEYWTPLDYGKFQTPPASDIMYGDINEDGSADLTDLTMLGLFLMGGIELTDSQTEAADIDGNGENDIRDLAHFKRYICKENVTLGPQKAKQHILKKITSYKMLYGLMKTSYDFTASPVWTNSNYYAVSTQDNDPDTVNDSTDSIYKPDSQKSMVKTDGDAVYSLSDDKSMLNVTYLNDGKFEINQFTALDFSDRSLGYISSPKPTSLNLYKDKIVLTGTVSISRTPSFAKLENKDTYTFVSVYKKGDKETPPELVDTYYQCGNKPDFNISSDGKINLVTKGSFKGIIFPLDNDYSNLSETKRSIIEYNEDYLVDYIIPSAGTHEKLIPAPAESLYFASLSTCALHREFSAVGTIDISAEDSVKASDFKVISGMNDNCAVSDNDIYLTGTENYITPDYTDIVHISSYDGLLSPDHNSFVRGIKVTGSALSINNQNLRIGIKDSTGGISNVTVNTYVFSNELNEISRSEGFSADTNDNSDAAAFLEHYTGYINLDNNMVRINDSDLDLDRMYFFKDQIYAFGNNEIFSIDPETYTETDSLIFKYY